MVRWAQQYHNWPAKVQVEWNKNPGVRGCLTAAHHSCVTPLMDYRRRRRSSFNTHASSSRSKNLSVVPEGAAVEITDGCLIMWKKNALRRSTYNQIFSRQVSRSKKFLAHYDWKFKFSLKFFYLRWFRRVSALIWLHIFADWISGKTWFIVCQKCYAWTVDLLSVCLRNCGSFRGKTLSWLLDGRWFLNTFRQWLSICDRTYRQCSQLAVFVSECLQLFA